MSASLFARLFDRLEQEDVAIGSREGVRYIKRRNSGDAELMAGAEVRALTVTRQIRIVQVDWNSERYFCVFGLAELSLAEMPGGLMEVELTPGLFALSILESGVGPSASAMEIKEAIEDYYQMEGVDYLGHELSEISRLFPKISSYATDGNFDYHDDIYRVLGVLLAHGYFDGPIYFEAATVSALKDVFEVGDGFIPYRNIVQGMLSMSWENFFLETYRCVEQLYSRPRIAALRSEWPSALSLRKLAVLLEEHLSWRPKEEDSLSGLVRESGDGVIGELCMALGVDKTGKEVDDLAKIAARKIYSLRNEIVHYRPIHEAVNKTESDWNNIVQAMLLLVKEVYRSAGGDFFEEGEIAV